MVVILWQIKTCIIFYIIMNVKFLPFYFIYKTILLYLNCMMNLIKYSINMFNDKCNIFEKLIYQPTTIIKVKYMTLISIIDIKNTNHEII